MAEEKKNSAAKEFLVKHGEKVGLGTAAAALLAYLLLGVVMAKDDPSLRALKSEADRIDAEKSKSHGHLTLPEVKTDSGAVLGPWNVVTTAKAGSDAVARLVPELKINEVDKAKEFVKAAVAPTIAFGTSAVDFDGVTITWTMKEFTKQEMAKGAKDFDYLKLTGFVVERETNGSGKWEKVADLDVKTLTYKDTQIDPKTKYAYRVTSVLEADANPKREEKAKPMTVATPAPILTKTIWKITFTNPSKPAGAAKGMVYVKIEKYEKGRGTIEKSHIQYEGDKIGWWEEQPGGEPVSIHRVSKEGKAFTVDFNTGYGLVSVEPKRVTIEIKKCKKKYDQGNWVGCDPLIEKRTVSTNEIVYTDEGGEKKILVPAPPELDDLCENHGGKPKTAEVKKTTEAAPDQPKEDPKAVAARKREETAAKMFADAEKAEAAKNKSQAYSLYKKLMDDYAETDFVAKQNLEVIKDRLVRLK